MKPIRIANEYVKEIESAKLPAELTTMQAKVNFLIGLGLGYFREGKPSDGKENNQLRDTDVRIMSEEVVPCVCQGTEADTNG